MQSNVETRGGFMNGETGSNEKIRYAVAGLGHIVQVAVLPAFKKAQNSELVSIISGDATKRRELAHKYRLKTVYSYEEYEQALSEVDAVYIGLPNHLHREYTIKAAEAGKHVLCEKPMAVTVEDCEAMIEAARRNNTKLMVAYRLHFEQGNLEAVQIANDGTLGEPRFFSSDFGQQVVADNIRVTEPVERGGGPVYDMGVYCINAARYLFREEPVEVMAFSAKKGEQRFSKVDEMTSVAMRFPGDRLASFTCSFGSADVSRYTLVGTKGTLTAEPAYEYSSGITYRTTIDGKTKTIKIPKRDQFAAELLYFSRCIQQDKQPEPSGVEGLADVRIIEAIYESTKSGKAVKIAPPEKSERPSLDQEIHRPGHEKPETIKVKSPSGEAA
jgi:predicted dehydrogenase